MDRSIRQKIVLLKIPCTGYFWKNLTPASDTLRYRVRLYAE
jgi:hypothetical protein